MTVAQPEFKMSRADIVETLELRLFGDILVPKVEGDLDFDPAAVTLENLASLLRREHPGEDISRGVIYTDDWHCKDRRVRNHNNVFISWPSEDGTQIINKQLQGPPEDGVFIVEDLERGAQGGGVKYFPPQKNDLPTAANDNEPATKRSAKRLTEEEQRERLERFQREQLLPGERGEIQHGEPFWRGGDEGAFWYINGAIVEGYAGDIFLDGLSFQPKFRSEDGEHHQITEMTPFPLVDPSEWKGIVAAVREWFITGLIPHRQVTLLSGDGGVGKSLLGLQIGAASALAIETLGLHPRPGRVLYLGAEDEAEEFHRRLEAICAAHGRDVGDLADLRILPLADQDALLSMPDPKGNMESTALYRRVDRFVKKWEPRLVVLDTAADLFGGDEVKRSQVRHFVAMLRKMAIERDCAVLLLAHPSIAGMASGSGYSGSTAWNNSVRSRLYLTSGEGDVRILKTVKSNYGKIGDEMQLEWCEGAFVLHDPSKPGVADGLLNGRADKLFLAVLSKLNRTGQRPSPNKSPSYAPKMIQKHPDARGSKLRDLEMAMQRLLETGEIKVVQEGPPSRRFSRLLVSAEDFGGAHDG